MSAARDLYEAFDADSFAWLPGLPASTEQYLQDVGLVPPGEEGKRADDEQAKALEYSNDLLLFGRVPRAFGKRRMFPPLAALPIQVTRAGKDVIVVVFTFGPGPLKLDELAFGNVMLNEGKRETSTAVRTINDEESPLNGVRYEIREGAAGDPDLTLYPAFGTSQSAGSYLELKKSDGWVSLPLSPPAPRDFTIELQFPNGLGTIASNGTVSQKAVDFLYRSRPVKADGSYADEWKPSAEGWRFTAKAGQRTTYETSKHFNTPFPSDPRAIRVQVKRDSADDHNGSTKLSKSLLKGLISTVSQQPVKKAGFCLVAVEFPADLLTGNGVPRFSGVPTSVLPVWNGSNWSTTAETRNPAALIRHVLTSAENKRAIPLSRVDEANLGAFWTDCKGASSDGNLQPDRACDVHFTGGMRIREMLRLIASCGRGTVTRVDGKYGVRVDKAWSGDPAAHFTPGNSWGFNAHKVLSRKVHGVRCEFDSRGKDWNPDTRLVFDDGYSVDGAIAGTVAATEYEPMSFPGMVDVLQVVREARYRIAARRLRPEVYELWTRWEHVVCTRGDLVRVNHDVPQWGTMWGTVKSVAGADVGVSHRVTMETAHSYAMRFRTAAGVDVYRTVTLNVGEQAVVTLSSAPTGVAVGDLFQFGELSPGPSVDLLVLGIYPEEDLVARLLLVDYNAAIYTADTGTIPQFDPKMTAPPPTLTYVPPPAKPGTSDTPVINHGSIGPPTRRLVDPAPTFTVVQSAPAGVTLATLLAAGTLQKT